jgi:ectoine hydroxylase-related dioxygenase (phytanoyl-CoA dioxygenase family)
MRALTQEQYDAFWRDGCLVIPDAVSPEQLQALRSALSGWIEESRTHSGAWGELMDGRPRYDVAKDHSAERPLLRRVNNPCEVSDAFENAMADSRMTDAVADLIGPNVAYHHSKINLKLPGADTEVGWHQDYPFTPHTNDDLITALLFLDDVTEENGALMVVPGSHKEGIRSLWRNGRFAGMVGPAEEQDAKERAISAIGPAGSVCLMHTSLLHGSKANGSTRSRNLFITVYRAADAVPLAPSPVPSVLEGRVVRGEPVNKVRLTMKDVELPANIKTSSFFNIQAAAREAA